MHRTSSVRSSSSHRSTIETRGVPEFDREYARQLSVAKRGGGSSVKPSPRPGLVHESPVDAQLQGPAAVAASRIKDYVATHVTPPRIPHLGTPNRGGTGGGGGSSSGSGSGSKTTSRGAAAARADHPASPPPTMPPPAPIQRSTGGGGDGAASPPQLQSTLRGSSTANAVAAAMSATAVASSTPAPSRSPPIAAVANADDRSDGVALSIFKTVAVVVTVLCVLLCLTAFVCAADADYNPSYFTLGGAAKSQGRTGSGVVARRGWPDRLVPEPHRQIALHVRRAIWSMAPYTGIPSVARGAGSLLSAARTYVSAPMLRVLPRLDRTVHPALRYFSSNATGGAEGWGLSAVPTIAASVARSLVQLVVEPLFIVGRTAQAFARWVAASTAVLAKPLKPLQAGPSKNASAAVGRAPPPPHNRTAARTGSTAASALLTFWRPLHFLWSAIAAAASLSDAPSLSHRRNVSANASAAPHTPALPPRTPQAAAPPPAEVQRVEVKTSHTRRLEGDMWAALLAAHRDELEALATDDVWELLRSSSGGDEADGAARPVAVTLRAGSLVVDVTVASLAADTRGTTKTTESLASTRHAALDARLQQWHFPRLQAFYARAATAAQEASDSRTAATAECEARVEACRRESGAAQRRLERQLQGCASNASSSQREAASGHVEAELRKWDTALQECKADAAQCSTELAMQTSRAAACAQQSDDCNAALAKARQSAAEADATSAANARATEAEHEQRCAASLAGAASECEGRVQDARMVAESDGAAQLAAHQTTCTAAAQAAAEDCASRQAALERAVLEKADARCSERLSASLAASNVSAASGIAEVQAALTSARADRDERAAACAAAADEAAAAFFAERDELQRACAAERSTIGRQCEAAEREAAEKQCAATLTSLEKNLQAASTAAAQEAEQLCQVRLAREVTALNTSVTGATAQLRQALEDSVKAADACAAAQAQLQGECTARLAEQEKRASANLAAARDEARASQERASAVEWARKEAQLTAQCATAVAEQQQRASVQVQRAEETWRRESAAAHEEHQKRVRELVAQVASCAAEARGAAAAEQQAKRQARQRLEATVTDSAEQACLLATRGSTQVCAALRQATEAELRHLPANATAADTLGHVLAAVTAGGRLSWNFSGTPAQVHVAGRGAPVASGVRTSRSAATLHFAGMVLGLGAAAYALWWRQQDRLVYEGIIHRLSSLLAASGRAGVAKGDRARHADSIRSDEAAAATLALAEKYLSSAAEALLAWHSTCGAVLLEQAGSGLGRPPRTTAAAADTFTSISESVLGDPRALSISHGGLGTSLMSASTVRAADADAAQVSQLLAAFVRGYYGVLEMYYVDLLNAVANRELAESQLQEVEAVAARQAAVLHRQSAVVAQLKQDRSTSEAAPLRERLAKADRRTAAQAETIALLEEQLRISRSELDKARGVVQTPAPTPRSAVPAPATAADSSTSRQVRSLQELAADGGEGDSINTSDFSNAERGAAVHRDPSNSGALPSAMKRSTMVRNPDVTRRYHKLQWNDDVGKT